MKTKRPSEDTPVPLPVESVVEDLSQQDVLPSGNASDVIPDMETIVDPESQSGRWDEPMGEPGHRASRVPLEDEASAAEQLVDKGINEADEELRDLDEAEEMEEEGEEL
jgi:hypothetical protein